MARLVFKRGQQKEFLEAVLLELKLNSARMGSLIGISQKSMQRWLNETTLGNQTSLKKLSRLSNVPLPQPLEIHPEYWGNKLCHNPPPKKVPIKRKPGNAAGRSKGGKISQQRRREHPEHYPSVITANTFKKPGRNNPYLSEFIGIVLGDGSITKGQVHITLNELADQYYIPYVRQLAHRLFDYHPSLYQHKHDHGISLIITGVNFTQYLLSLGLKIGDKVKLQVDVPEWIKADNQLSKHCLKGLMDTDGGIFTHRYKVNHKTYSYLKAQFSNRSTPLRFFVHHTLQAEGFTPKFAGDKHVWLYSDSEARQYLQVIGSSNYRLLRKIR